MNNQNNILKENKMRHTPIGKLLFSMALPAIFSMLIQALYNIVDSLFVARISSSNDELTALNYAFPLQMICLAIALGIGIGTSSVISRKLGAKLQNDANNAATTGIFLAICAALLIFILSFFVPRLFLNIYNDSKHIKDLAVNYLSITMACSVGMFLEITITKILQGTGNMIIPMLSQLLGAITNIVLDPIFIFNAGEGIGLPFGFGLGVTGAAIATVLGQCLSGVFCIGIILFQKHHVSFSFKNFKIRREILQGIFSVGIATTVMNSINALTTIVLNLILSSSGVTILGTYFKVQSFIFMPVFGLTQGALPIMGFNYGAKEKERFFKTFRLSVYTSLTIMTFGLLLFQFGSTFITNMFNLGEISNLASNAFRIICLCFIPAAISIIISTMFQSIGHGYKSMLMSLLRQAVFLIPCALILKAITHADNAVWWAYPISELLCFSVFSGIAYKTSKTLFPKTKTI